MRIGEVIGRVVLSRCDREFEAGRFMIVRPCDLEALEGKAPPTGEIVVAYDELSASDGMRVGLSEGREAAMPFHPKPVALDVYIGCLLDEVVIETEKPRKRESEKAKKHDGRPASKTRVTIQPDAAQDHRAP